jgi:hypothetical protein
MTSVRPKLKPETPKAVTAWETATGKSVWMTEVGTWSDEVSKAAAFTGEVAAAGRQGDRSLFPGSDGNRWHHRARDDP